LVSKGRLVVHALVLIYAAILAYVLLGLELNFHIDPQVFFDLSFALLFFALGQAIYELGAKRAGIFFGITVLLGYGAEVLGTNTGFPFGSYVYSHVLGPKAFGVPLMVPVVWFVIAYIAMSMVVGRGRKQLGLVAALTAFGVVSWDLLIDPMFSSPSYGYWTWLDSQSVATLAGVPLTNFLGWFLLGLVMIALFLYTMPKERPILKRKNRSDSMIIYVLLMIDGALANIALGNPLVVLIGVSAMLIFLVVSIERARREDRGPDRTIDHVPMQTNPK
jgi:uncharacterized membrane protein